MYLYVYCIYVLKFWNNFKCTEKLREGHKEIFPEPFGGKLLVSEASSEPLWELVSSSLEPEEHGVWDASPVWEGGWLPWKGPASQPESQGAWDPTGLRWTQMDWVTLRGTAPRGCLERPGGACRNQRGRQRLSHRPSPVPAPLQTSTPSGSLLDRD